jgi:hypothetical protein
MIEIRPKCPTCSWDMLFVVGDPGPGGGWECEKCGQYLPEDGVPITSRVEVRAIPKYGDPTAPLRQPTDSEVDEATLLLAQILYFHLPKQVSQSLYEYYKTEEAYKDAIRPAVERLLRFASDKFWDGYKEGLWDADNEEKL